MLDERLRLTPALHRAGQPLFEDAHAAFERAVLAAACVDSDSSVLEVGCGWGALAQSAVLRLGCRHATQQRPEHRCHCALTTFGRITTHCVQAQHLPSRCFLCFCPAVTTMLDMLCSWLATSLSKAQLERVSQLAQAPEVCGQLTCRYAGWQSFAAVLPQGTHFSHVLCLDPMTVALLRPQDMRAFFAQQRAMLAADGTLVMLVLSASPAFAAAPSCFGTGAGALAGRQLPTRSEVSAAAEAAGFVQEEAVKLPDGVCELSGHYAATLRQWRLRLISRWRDARMLGAPDTALRRRVLIYL